MHFIINITFSGIKKQEKNTINNILNHRRSLDIFASESIMILKEHKMSGQKEVSNGFF